MLDVIMPVLIFDDEGLNLTKEAINSLGNVNLIIIDDASPVGGGYLRMIADTYVRNKKNVGFPGSVNKGLKLAGDGLIAVVNNDTKVSPNWQEVTREVMQDKNTFSCHLRMTDYGVPFKYGNKIWYTGMERWCQASFFIIDGKKKIYLDEDLYYSYNDWDYFYRARLKWKTAYTNKACFQHNHSFTRKQQKDLSKEDAEKFKVKYGDYAENIMLKLYPEQMSVDWKKGFDKDL